MDTQLKAIKILTPVAIVTNVRLKLVRNSTTDAIKVAHTIFVEGALLAHKVTSLDRRTQDLDTTCRVAI